MLLTTSLTSKAELVVNKDNQLQFCYERNQAEKILECFKMKKAYEDLQVKRTEAPSLSPSETTFFDTTLGRICFFVAGFGLGYTVSELKH